MAQAIEKSEWPYFCERMTSALDSAEAEVEVASLELGDQIETEWLPLIGITYDPNDDLFDIALEGIDHLVEHPQQLRVDGPPGALSALEIVDSNGIQHLVKLRDALMLPRAH